MRKILFIIIVAVFLMIINNLLRSIYDIWQKKDFVAQAEKELEQQKEKNKKLKSELSFVQTPEFIEKEARDKLLMVKKGEQKVLIPKNIDEKEHESKKEREPNWKKWWNLFFE